MLNAGHVIRPLVIPSYVILSYVILSYVILSLSKGCRRAVEGRQPRKAVAVLTDPRRGCTLDDELGIARSTFASRAFGGPMKCVTLAVVCALLTGCGQRDAGWAGQSALLPASSRFSSGEYIQHVVVMIQENRSYDNLFATFPGGDGATNGKTHDGKTIRLKQGGLQFDSLGHQHFAFEKEYDHGRMDGFDLVSRAIGRGDKIPAGNYAYRYVNPESIAPYWALARQYVLADHMFSTQSSSSFTAHQDLIAGGTPVGDGENVIDFPTPSAWGCDAAPGTVTSLITARGHYLRDAGPFPCFTYATLRDLLDAKGISWLYFTNAMPSSVWNAFDAISAVRNGSEWTQKIVIPQRRIFSTVRQGVLPAVSWVIPDALDSDHPGIHSDSGPSWVARVVDAIGESPYWDSTAIVVLWDDWGGEYDHVPPPQLDGQGLGMRVPMLVISAYARRGFAGQSGFISHQQYEFGSILKFVEDNWHLGRLGTSDVRAKSIADCFDFTQPPRSFIPIQAKYSQSYFERRPASGLPVDTY